MWGVYDLHATAHHVWEVLINQKDIVADKPQYTHRVIGQKRLLAGEVVEADCVFWITFEGQHFDNAWSDDEVLAHLRSFLGGLSVHVFRVVRAWVDGKFSASLRVSMNSKHDADLAAVRLRQKGFHAGLASPSSVVDRVVHNIGASTQLMPSELVFALLQHVCFAFLRRRLMLCFVGTVEHVVPIWLLSGQYQEAAEDATIILDCLIWVDAIKPMTYVKGRLLDLSRRRFWERHCSNISDLIAFIGGEHRLDMVLPLLFMRRRAQVVACLYACCD